MKIKYTGPDDARILDAKDLAKADVEGFKKTRFDKDQVVEIDDAAAEGILRTPEVYGDFEVVTDDAEAESKSTKNKAKAADQGAITETSSASTSDSPATRPTGRASTGS